MYALITGGSRGLGFYIARELKNRGYDPILISRDDKILRNAAMELDAAYYVIDLSKDYEKLEKIIRDLKPVIIVNNAGFGVYGDIKEQNWERLKDMITVNILALTYITKIALETSKKGYILNISSVAACRAQKKLSVYAATKAYVAHLSQCLAKDGWQVSYLLLGPTRTDFFKNANMPPKNLDRIMLNPESVARYAVDKMLKGKRRIVPGIIYKLYCLGK